TVPEIDLPIVRLGGVAFDETDVLLDHFRVLLRHSGKRGEEPAVADTSLAEILRSGELLDVVEVDASGVDLFRVEIAAEVLGRALPFRAEQKAQRLCGGAITLRHALQQLCERLGREISAMVLSPAPLSGVLAPSCSSA